MSWQVAHVWNNPKQTTSSQQCLIQLIYTAFLPFSVLYWCYIGWHKPMTRMESWENIYCDIVTSLSYLESSKTAQYSLL